MGDWQLFGLHGSSDRNRPGKPAALDRISERPVARTVLASDKRKKASKRKQATRTADGKRLPQTRGLGMC